MSTLYVVATPIGNLGDITGRAIDILNSVSLIAAEDTRVTRKLLNHIGSKARTLSYNENSPPSRLRQMLDHLDTADLALVTDAGTPGVSDPGAELVSAAAAAGHDISPIAGPSSATAALSISGFDTRRFMFLGFLPRKASARRDELAQHLTAPVANIILESPHRLIATLKAINDIAPDRQIAVCRELTKLHEEVFRGTPEEAIQHFKEPRGEFVIVVAPAPARDEAPDEGEIAASAARAIADGLSGRSAVEHVMAETGAARSIAYPAVLKAQEPE